MASLKRYVYTCVNLYIYKDCVYIQIVRAYGRSGAPTFSPIFLGRFISDDEMDLGFRVGSSNSCEGYACCSNAG